MREKLKATWEVKVQVEKENSVPEVRFSVVVEVALQASYTVAAPGMAEDNCKAGDKPAAAGGGELHKMARCFCLLAHPWARSLTYRAYSAGSFLDLSLCTALELAHLYVIDGSVRPFS